MAKLRKKGIFYLLEGEETKRLAAPLGLKMIEKKVIEPDGTATINLSCGFPDVAAGLPSRNKKAHSNAPATNK